jgi:hypothetical protein
MEEQREPGWLPSKARNQNLGIRSLSEQSFPQSFFIRHHLMSKGLVFR